MTKLDGGEINCSKCSAPCCTFVANSMQVTPLEALELYNFLDKNQLLTKELIEEIKETITHYRLDNDISTKKNQTFRKTYTCPLFSATPQGCPVAPEFKPYGCLGFNPLSAEVTEGENCTSRIDLLENQDETFSEIEEVANQKICEHFSWHWKKLPLPVALLEVHKLRLKGL